MALTEVSVMLCLFDNSSLGVTTDGVRVLLMNRTFSFWVGRNLRTKIGSWIFPFLGCGHDWYTTSLSYMILKDGRLNLCDGGSCNLTEVILSLEVFFGFFWEVFHVSFREIVLSEVFHGVVGEVREAPFSHFRVSWRPVLRCLNLFEWSRYKLTSVQRTA